MFIFSLFLFVLIDFKIYNSYKDIPQAWNCNAGHDIFLQKGYLEALETASPSNITLYYVGVFKHQELVGISIIQRAQLYLKDMFRNTTSTIFKEFLKNNLSRVLRGNILVIGNLTHTGQHGIYFLKTKISQKEILETLYTAIGQLQLLIKQNQRKNIRLIMFKDYFKTDSIHLEENYLKSKQFYKVHVQPNMIMKIRPEWLVFQDYITNMNTKYRTRYKRARKKFGEISCRELDEESINNNSQILHDLYMNVSDNAAFNTFLLPKNHFLNLKQKLKDNFRVFGYYLENELVGFYTLILNNKALETYFLGYDKEHQYPNQLYLNMLYDMAEFAIENKFISVVYARTAMEIKSSVGAKPVDMIMYMKHTNGSVNAVLKFIFNLMNPSQKWVERNPFKTL